MSSPKNLFKFILKAGIVVGYLGLILVLVMQALTPGSESSNISNSVGDKLNDVVTDIQKPEAETVEVEEVKLHSLTVEGVEYADNIIIFIGQSGTVNCTVLPDNATNPSLSYHSSDESVLEIYSNGRIFAVGKGSAKITVCSAENESLGDEITITVLKVLPEGIEIDNLPPELRVGDAHRLDLVFRPTNTSDRSVIWESSDETVISVSESGKLTAMAEGTATVSVTSVADPSLNSSVEITVLPKPDVPMIPPESLTIESDTTVGYIGSTIKLSAKLYPTNADGNVEWYSSDEGVATISQKGILTCLKEGEVTVIARCAENIEHSITISIKEVLSKNIRLDFEDVKAFGNGYTMKQGKSGRVIAILDENATIRNVTFTSSNENVARIGADGVIEALAGGSTTITVYTEYEGEITEASFILNIERITLKDTVENFYYLIRKSIGHFGAFFVLGILGSFTYYIIFKKDLIGTLFAGGVNLVAGFAVAGITEILQLPYFTQGRYCSFDDVLLDFSGYCMSSIPIYLVIILIHLVAFLFKKIKNK